MGPHAHPEVSLHTHSLADYVDRLDRGDRAGVAELMLSSAHKLARAGADFLICPDNTIHQAMSHVLPHSPLPWLHIAEVVAAEASARGYRKLGITGTRWLIDSEVYPEKIEAERDALNQIIMDELVQSRFTSQGIVTFQRVMGRMKEQGCDAVVLGCTEIPLIMNDGNSPLPTLDSTRLLARAALKRAVTGASGR
jgi:aspartate racemase